MKSSKGGSTSKTVSVTAANSSTCAPVVCSLDGVLCSNMLWVCVFHHVFITSSCWSHFSFSLIGAEFKKTDRSLLVSPDGSSRVPFDPQQKPKFGVLKAPPTPLSANMKRTPAGKKKGGAPKSTPKRRVVASDFF